MLYCFSSLAALQQLTPLGLLPFQILVLIAHTIITISYTIPVGPTALTFFIVFESFRISSHIALHHIE